MFRRTDSLSRNRTSTCEGTVTRSVKDTTKAAPRPEPTDSRFDVPSSTHTHSHCGVLDSTKDWEGWPHMRVRGGTSCNDPASLQDFFFFTLVSIPGAICCRASSPCLAC